MANIYLIGFMGAGKTTVGKILAEKTGKKLTDIDQEIVTIIGCSVNDYFTKHGEEQFRQVEHDVLSSFKTETNGAIISTGGGIVLKNENRQYLKEQAYVVYLKADPGVFIERIRQDEGAVRPLAVSKTNDEIEAVYLPRVKLYEESASIIVDTTSLTPEAVADQIIREIQNISEMSL